MSRLRASCTSGRNPTDERQVEVMRRASAATGQLLTTVVVGGFLISLAVGAERYAETFAYLGAVAGVCFIGSTIWCSHRV